MDILKFPSDISLSGNMQKCIISTPYDISFVLTDNTTGEVVIEHSYSPSADHLIEVDLKPIIQPLLSFHLQNVTTIYKQPDIMHSFTVEIAEVVYGVKQDPTSRSFKVFRTGVDELADSPHNFLKSNFLTWQPNVKGVTYYSPEFLTYYASEQVIVKCTAYVAPAATVPGSFAAGLTSSTITLATLAAGSVYTIPVSYSVIASKLDGQYPSYYDIWVENESGNRLTYIQRYYAENMKSPDEKWILFENSLGGIDTFRACGNSENTAEHTHNVVEIDDNSQEYRVDTERTYNKNTGYLDKKERVWLLDFFPSLGKYIYIGNHLRRIVVTESDASYTDKELPSFYTFKYKYADARPYLNIPRTDTPQEVLNISVPDLGSFTIAPRLVEFPRLPLSDGALLPIQDPYSEEWNATSIGELFEYVVANLHQQAGSGSGDVGHTHNNMSLLNALTLVSGYLLANGKKINAGFADMAGTLSADSDIWNKFIRKDINDTAAGLITFLQGLKSLGEIFSEGKITAKGGVEFGEFVKGLYDGRGGSVDAKGNAEFESLRVRSYMQVMELIVNRVRAMDGDTVLTEGDTIESVEEVTDAEGHVSYKLKLKEQWDGYYTAQAVGNVIKGVINTLAQGSGTYYTSWMLVKDVNTTTNTITVDIYPDDETPAGQNFPPCEMMNIVRWGNAIDEKRQSCIYLSSTEGVIKKLIRVTKPIIDKGNDGFIIGNLPEWLTKDPSVPVDEGDDAVYVKTLLYQNIHQVDYKGKRQPVYVDRGNWEQNPAEPYHFEATNSVTGVYETSDVWYYGCKWRCIKDCPTDTPKWNSMQWMQIEGNPDFAIEIDIENGGLLDFDYFSTHGTDLTVKGRIYNMDVTQDILDADVVWTRYSEFPDGTPRTESDNVWNLGGHTGKTLHITTDDLNIDSSGMPSTLSFTATALLRDGVAAEDSISII